MLLGRLSAIVAMAVCLAPVCEGQGTKRTRPGAPKSAISRAAGGQTPCEGEDCSPNDVDEAVRKFAEVYALVERESAGGVDPNRAIYEGALPAMLRQLDPHTVFFTPGQFDQLKDLQRSTSKGFGTVVSVLPGRVIVLQAIQGSPSAKAGIEPGDEILAINNVRLDWLDLEQLVGLLGDSRRKEAKLHVRRSGAPRILEFTLSPQDLESPSVERAFELAPGVGYIRVSNFEGETGRQFKEAVEKLGGSKLKGLVIDLRNNPGGVLSSGLEMASLFLPPGAKLLSVRGRSREGEETTVPDNNVPYEFPVAVLINEKTASAAEIVAGALQDNDRAAITGLASFGKGLVQSVYPLSQGTGLALTTAFYFTPSGRSVQRPLTDSQIAGVPRWSSIDAGGKFRTAGGRTVRGGGGIEPDYVVGPERHTRLRAVLDASASFTTYATVYIKKHGPIDANHKVTDRSLDEFQAFLSENRITPSVGEWSLDRDWIRHRLLQEVLNQTLGVDKGDEVEARRDPQVQKAMETLNRPRATLRFD